MMAEQKGLCAICQTQLEESNIDHDHTTGEVRGLLCTPCNLGIGMFKDNPDVLNRAIRYLGGSFIS